MVGAITVVSQEAAQVLESAGEGPLGKNILIHFVEYLKSLFPSCLQLVVIYRHKKIPVILLEYMFMQLSRLWGWVFLFVLVCVLLVG